MSTNIEAISSVNEYDETEPPIEQLFTDSDEEYDVNKDQCVESYLDDEEWNEDDYTSEEESEVEVNIENEGEIMKRFDVEDNEKISLEKFMIFVDADLPQELTSTGRFGTSMSALRHLGHIVLTVF
ncbi:uncharacterized protein DS421_7g205370 [Arachis hypogaea]|nr:uncharacterized protein DS421_7g205370 [Arachis hypogaea]